MERPEVVCLLEHMSNSIEPVGSGRACHVLVNAGYSVSEATVGRLLRYMDDQGYTYKQGYRGRELTEHGRVFIGQFTEKQSRRLYSNKLAEIVGGNSMEGLLETLVARRAIEREVARLAAININFQHGELLQQIVDDYQFATGDRVAHGDVAFHNALADAAGNKVLKAALDLIRQDAQLSPVFGHIRQRMHGKVFADHKSIADAVLAGDSVAAEQAMVKHIENLIADVRRYWALVNESE